MRRDFCPNCQTTLPEEAALACPECGSCEETGWSERAQYEAIDVDYDGEFDYIIDKFISNEFISEEFQAEKDWDKRRLFLVILSILMIILVVVVF